MRKFLIVLTIALVIILSAVVWMLPPNDDFRGENPFWNGTKDMSLTMQASLLESLSVLSLLPKDATLILIPYLDFTPAELEEIRSFVTQGGTLVVADDYGFGNQILEYLGLEARFSGHALLDPLFNYKNKWFPRVTHIMSSPITRNVESLVLNHATCLTGVKISDALALSSSASFLDLNSNEAHDEGEPNGRLTVISHHSLGNGYVILISDPSIFINSMEEMESNSVLLQNIAAINNSMEKMERDSELLQNIAAITPSRLFIGYLFIDQSHLPPSNLQHTKNLLAYTLGALRTPVGMVALAVVALTITLMPIWHRRRQH